MSRVTALLFVLALALAACGRDASEGPDGLAEGDDRAGAPEDAAGAGEDPADDEPAAAPDVAEDPEPQATPGEGLTVVATVFPMAWLGDRVAPGADVAFLGASGQDPHDLELSPGDRALLETADVVLYMGDLDFQPQVERAIAAATGQVVDVRGVAGDDALISLDHADDGHDDGDEHGQYDPHVWFDPAVMADVVVEIADAFAAADAGNAEAYTASAEELRAELLDLDAALDAMLSGCRLDSAIVSHEAYAYLLEPRGLHQMGISGAGGHGEASPQRLAELSATIEREAIPAVLAEPVHGRDDAEALARESGVALLGIDPLEIATDEQFERGYPELLREQGKQFATAMDCQGAQ